ncbi:unnamed protein product [Lactuca virosa]|uniref:Acyl-[acyl-carrier-protein] hydrolase n=1 Tax=Lactuca virosa TaxID=75947 RepID=A0AAU9MJK2_9ASTR|nr:unnamed protein product [Lactuca virosa]
MTVMITSASSIIMNTFTYPDIISSKFGCTPGAMHEHENIKLKHASSWSRQFKAPTKVNLKKVGDMDWSIVDQKKECPFMVSDLHVERMIQDGFLFQENFCIGIYEVGPDQTASLETLMNHLQIDTWKAAYGKNGLCGNFTFRDCKTGEILVRASSLVVMMNKKTRKLSKFPNEVRAKLEQIIMDKPPLVEPDTRTWSRSEEKINEHICKGLKSVPKTIIENYEIDSITLEFYRECTKDNILHSFTSILTNDNDQISNFDIVDCQHLLQFETGGNIMKGMTRWRLKHGKSKDLEHQLNLQQ